MKPPPFELVRPPALDEALEALSTHPDAKVLAGGQSLIPLLSMRLASPAMLVDINGIEELDYVRTDPEGVRVGALARHADVEADPEARRAQPLVSLALRHVGHATIRNRGTTVGSIVHADASAEMPVVLCLLGGRVTVASPSGRRDIEAADLYLATMECSVNHDEIAVEAFFPALQDGEGVAFDEVARREGDYALCGVGVRVRVEGERVASVQAGYLSVADVPTVVDLTTAFPEGRLDEAGLAAAGELALASLDPVDDVHASASYRRQLVRTLTSRVVRSAHQDAIARQDHAGGAR